MNDLLLIIGILLMFIGVNGLIGVIREIKNL
jgi:hypothetical protein